MAHNDTNTKCLAKKYLSLVLFILCAQAQIQVAVAAILLEQDFDTLGNCSTGRENTCWTDNGFSSGHNDTFKSGTIKGDGGIQGSGYFRIQMNFGQVSTGRVEIDITDSSTVYWGSFVRFSPDYMFYNETHGPGVRILGDSPCDMGGNWEPSNNSFYYLAEAGDCGITGGNHHLDGNQTARTTFKGGRWYYVQHQVTVDTSCTDATAIDGCNGIYRMWVDGVLWSEHTDVNFAAIAENAQVKVFGWEYYFHNGWPGHAGTNPYVDFDSLIVATTKAETDLPEGVTQGTASTTSYYMGCLANNNISRQYSDCLAPGPFSSRGNCSFGETWKNSAYIAQSTTTPSGNNQYPPDATDCPTEAAETDAYLELTVVSGDGAGIAFPRDGFGEFYDGAGALDWYDHWFIHGWIYLNSANDYSNNPLLAGFRAEKDGNDKRALAITVDNIGGTDRWAIGHRWNSATTSVLTYSTQTITEDAWVEFELWHNAAGEAVSLYIDATDNDTADGEYVINAFSLTGTSDAIMQDPGDDGGASAVVGVIDYDGTGSLNVAYDDYSVGTASFRSTDGWTEGDSPFSGSSSSSSGPTPAGNSFVGAIY